MKVMAVIPARAGSKRVRGKNLVDLCGKPLLAHSVAYGLQSQAIDKVVVSTDSEVIAAAAREYGAEAPFLRPESFAGDRVSDLPVMVHAFQTFAREYGYRADLLVLLRPTTPFRRRDLAARCVARLLELEADSVRSAREVGHKHPYWMLTVDESGRSEPFLPGKSVDSYYQSQLLPPVYQHDGYCDVIRSSNLPSNCTPEATMAGFYGEKRAVLLNDDSHFVNIDTPEDLEYARFVGARYPAD